jgi:hypothetical protein
VALAVETGIDDLDQLIVRREETGELWQSGFHNLQLLLPP